MEFRFHTDADGQPHISQHGVSANEVVEAMYRRSEDRPSREDSRLAIGRTLAGRVLRVIYVPDEDGVGIFVITAYELKGKPLKAFRARERKRGR